MTVHDSTQFTNWDISTLAKLQEDNEIKLDLAFQSVERWSTSARQSYLESVFSGFVPNPIILGDTTSCRDYCEEVLGKDSSDYHYFNKMINDGYKYVSVDGNNRTRTLTAFFKNTIKLVPNTSYRMSGITHPSYSIYQPTSAVTFKNIPDKVKQHIKTITIPVFIVHKATRQELHDMFIAVNNGVPLNPQEKRNAIVCKVADAIRTLGDKYKGMLRLYFSEANCDRRLHEEFIVSMLVHIAHGFNTNVMREDKDAAYNDKSVETAKLSQLRDVLKDMDNLIEYECKTGKSRGIPSKASLFDLAMLVHYLQTENISILQKGEFFEWFVETINALRNDQKTMITFGLDARTYYGAQRNSSSEVREARLGQLLAQLHTVPENVLSVQKDKKRFGDWNDRITLWTKQEHTCPLTGRTIPWEYVLDGSKTHLDHKVPHSKGGRTTLENQQLVMADANILKGNH